MSFRLCAIIPTYHHTLALPEILQALQELELPVIVIDDGNAPDIARELIEICARFEGVTLTRHEINGGKGAAVLTGLALAQRQGFTHGLQVDADGQHDISRTPELIALARAHPDALISAKPVYDDSIPRARLFARWITHVWVSINTLSPRIIDSMCGFRVYPLDATLTIARRDRPALRMGFDTEILVRLRWAGVEVVTLPVKVIYPLGNHSNFKPWDNVEVALMHARLFFTMLFSLPGRLKREMQKGRSSSRHWAALGERGSKLGLWILATIFQLFGRNICLIIMSPVIFFFFLTGVEQRKASRAYLHRVWQAGYLPARPDWMTSFRHFMAFGGAALDKLAAWTGKIDASSIDGLENEVRDVAHQNGRGLLLLTAHLGNPEVIRAVTSLSGRAKINVLVHTIHAVRFNELINAYSKTSSLRLIEVTSIGPDTAILLQNAIDRGEWVVIAGDRVPAGGNGRVSWIKFLGERAPFAQGPYILGSLLKCPVYLLFSLREGNRYRIYFEAFADRIVLPRSSRDATIKLYAERFVERLEHHISIAPLQWFNYFDFWHPAGMRAPEDATLSPAESELVR